MASKEYFKEIASKWDDMRQTFFSEQVRERAYEVAGVQKGGLAADIGAGTGFLTEGLLMKGLNVIAVDQSDAMLEQMKEKFREYSTVDYRVGEAEQLPIDEGTIDYVMANMYLHHVKNPFVAIREMVRTLKPGGSLVITDLDKHHHEFLKTEHHDEWMGFDRADIGKWLIESGLHHVVVDCVGGKCCANSSCGSEQANISIFIAYGQKSK